MVGCFGFFRDFFWAIPGGRPGLLSFFLGDEYSSTHTDSSRVRDQGDQEKARRNLYDPEHEDVENAEYLVPNTLYIPVFLPINHTLFEKGLTRNKHRLRFITTTPRTKTYHTSNHTQRNKKDNHHEHRMESQSHKHATNRSHLHKHWWSRNVQERNETANCKMDRIAYAYRRIRYCTSNEQAKEPQPAY